MSVTLPLLQPLFHHAVSSVDGAALGRVVVLVSPLSATPHPVTRLGCAQLAHQQSRAYGQRPCAQAAVAQCAALVLAWRVMIPVP